MTEYLKSDQQKTLLFQFPERVVELICSLLPNRDLCKLQLCQKGTIYENCQTFPLFFSTEFWKNRFTAQFGETLTSSFTDFLKCQTPSFPIPQFQNHHHHEIEDKRGTSLELSWYSWRSACFVGSLFRCPNCNSFQFPTFPQTILSSRQPKALSTEFRVTLMPCLSCNLDHPISNNSSHNLDDSNISSLRSSNTKLLQRCTTQRLIIHSINRSITLSPFFSCLSPAQSIDSFIPYYSSNVHGSSFAQLREHLTRRSIGTSGRELLFCISPTVLIVRCLNSNSLSNATETIAIFIDGRWPFKGYSTQICSEFDAQHKKQIRILSSSFKLNDSPNIHQIYTNRQNEASDFSVDPARGICFGGDFECAALAIDASFSSGSSYPSVEFGLPHSLVSGEAGDRFMIKSLEIWAPYWANYPERHHPSAASQRRILRQEQSSKFRSEPMGYSEELPKCLRNSKFLQAVLFGEGSREDAKKRVNIVQRDEVAQEGSQIDDEEKQNVGELREDSRKGIEEKIEEKIKDEGVDNDRLIDDIRTYDYWDSVSEDEYDNNRHLSDFNRENRGRARDTDTAILLPIIQPQRIDSTSN